MKFTKLNSFYFYFKDIFLVKLVPFYYYPLYVVYKLFHLFDIMFFSAKFRVTKVLFFLPKDKFILKNKLGKFQVSFFNENILVVSEYFEYFLKNYFKCKKKDIFLDLGSNIGIYSIFQAKKGFKKVIAFEPNPETLIQLKKNISLNNLNDKVFIVDKGLGNKKGDFYFEYDSSSLGLGKVIKNKFSHNKKLKLKQVQIIVLDDFIKNEKINVKKISCIKIDVEGFEKNVLIGGIRVFKNVVSGTKIIIEIWENQKNKNIIFSFFKDNNFKLKKNFGDNYMFIKE